MSPQEWLKVLKTAYLQGFIRQGGSSVKFVVVEEAGDTTAVVSGVGALAREEGYVTIETDSQHTKVQLIDLLFQEIAKQVDWEVLAFDCVRKLFQENNRRIPDQRDACSWGFLASLNDCDEATIQRDVNSWLEGSLFQDFQMSREFRLAMIQLCVAQLDPAGRQSKEAEAILAWLRGELRQMSVLKKMLIFQKITRSNARDLIASFSHWVRLIGKPGVVLTIDISAFMGTKKGDHSEALKYSPSAVMDAYEMLRQFIDGSDEMEGLLLVVITPKAFLTDQRLGLNRYEALKLRIWDDVRDKSHPNPFAPMVRITEEPTHFVENRLVARVGSRKDDVQHQRVIESLRAGVPSPGAVKALGCPQPTVKSKFQQMLQEAQASIQKGWTTKGLLIEGGFGTGKSHLLESLRHAALDSRFVCSKVVISKETPLYSPALMFRAAVGAADIPQKRGDALAEVAGELNFKSPQYAEFYEWVHRQGGEIDGRFAATLFLYERMVNDPELSHRMIRFWAGDPLSDVEIKRYLKSCDSSVSYRFERVSPMEMALQRFKFVSRLMVAAGYSGWILLIDEAEIIGRYSFKQRAQSYAELARWLGRLEASSFADLGYKSGLAAVMALTDDFQSAILEEKGDREKVPEKLRESGSETDLVLSRQAEQGMRLIECERIPLVGPYDQLVEEIYHKIRTIHGAAYGWDPPQVPTIERLSSTRMREYVKGWITEWDLKRLDPSLKVEIELSEIKQDYSEDIELESEQEDALQPALVESP
ncbi:MAG: ATP-binding protein [Nitrospirota bacterium]|nr:ATP-binding protein [Nitrospirota bacterium]